MPSDKGDRLFAPINTTAASDATPKRRTTESLISRQIAGQLSWDKPRRSRFYENQAKDYAAKALGKKTPKRRAQ